MLDLEINRKLALAIGWREDQMEQIGRDLCMRVEYFKVFDYTDWRVIGPIAEKFGYFPWQDYQGTWTLPIRYKNGVVAGFAEADTPQKAIALAVIQGAGK
jgi:hypothetical protein